VVILTRSEMKSRGDDRPAEPFTAVEAHSEAAGGAVGSDAAVAGIGNVIGVFGG